MISKKRLTKKWASASLVLGSVVAVLASPLALGTASAAPTAIQMTPHGTVANTTGTCQAYSVAAQDGASLAAGESVTLTVSETTATSTNPGATPFTIYGNVATPSDPCSGTAVPAGTVTGGGPYTITYTHAFTLDANGALNFGIASSATGTGSVNVAGGTASDQANVTWTAGGANAVTSLTASPTTVTQDTGTTANFTVTAKNSSGTPIQGVQVLEETNTVTSPDTLPNTTNCGATTNALGQATCSVHNGGTAGTDSLVFWVNNNAAVTQTQGPDSGEPQTTATAVFHTGPAVSAANSTLTCVQGLAGANQNTAQTNCTVPTSTHSVTFTATVEDASHNPLSGVTVNFAASSAKLGGITLTGTNLPSGTGTTNASGVATFVVNDANAQAGDSVAMAANVDGNAFGGTATVHWATPVATAVSVQPVLQSVAKGGTVTVKAQVVDQFGAAVSTQPALTYVVTGRNLGKTGSAAADGTITYTDAGTVPASNTDTITVTDATDHLTGSATVSYVTTTTATAVAVDTSGSGTSDATCNASGHTAATGVALGATTEVCATVKNATGEPLAGAPVTFTVSAGQVAAHGGLTTTSTTTYAATTDIAGVAFADVTSTKAGAQTVTATSGTATGSGTVTYTGPTPAQAYSIAVAPATGTAIAAGSSQKFVATVTDKNGNPVPGVTVVFTQTGAGSVGNGNTAITASDGTVNVTVSTTATDTGAGSVTFGIGNAPTAANQCATTGGICSATASYTVAPAGASSLTLVHNAVSVHGTVHVTATARKADGTPAAGQTVRFYVSGAATINNRAFTTGPQGKATLSFVANKAGKLTVAAFSDTNGDSIREATEPKATTTLTVSQAVKAEHPSILLTSNKGVVTIHVSTHPVARGAVVTYFVKRHGVWHRIGSSRTGPGGNASLHVASAKGQRLTFRATVSRTAHATRGTTPTRTITVR